jgi:hypothetical protein
VAVSNADCEVQHGPYSEDDDASSDAHASNLLSNHMARFPGKGVVPQNQQAKTESGPFAARGLRSDRGGVCSIW